MPYEIFGYSVVNGEKQVHKVFKNNIANDLEEIKKFTNKLERRYSKKYGHEVDVYVNFKIPIAEHKLIHAKK